MSNPFTSYPPITLKDTEGGMCAHGTLLAHGSCCFCDRDALKLELESINGGVKCNHDAAHFNAGADKFYCIHCHAEMGEAFRIVVAENTKLELENQQLRATLVQLSEPNK